MLLEQSLKAFLSRMISGLEGIRPPLEPVVARFCNVEHHQFESTSGEDTAFFFVFKDLLELALFAPNTFDITGDPRR